MDNKENNEVINEKEIVRKDSELEVDQSLLSVEEKEQISSTFPKGMLIFIIVLIVLIVGLSIAVALIE